MMAQTPVLASNKNSYMGAAFENPDGDQSNLNWLSLLHSRSNCKGPEPLSHRKLCSIIVPVLHSRSLLCQDCVEFPKALNHAVD